ncbi:hypothetical protein DPMN_166477 [Dreissena polymorpha]|uniref:Uncharacterized protein n=1 Tax=Dreissena polymorpha TaxID=45954 RepID=A0A9D4F296_DREPO|nr:hypothetical protein DPMN_166477 [Dreissena polymorpha]
MASGGGSELGDVSGDVDVNNVTEREKLLRKQEIGHLVSTLRRLYKAAELRMLDIQSVHDVKNVRTEIISYFRQFVKAQETYLKICASSERDEIIKEMENSKIECEEKNSSNRRMDFESNA